MKRPISASMLGRPARAVAAPFDLSKIDINWLFREREKVLARVVAKNAPITRVIPVSRKVTLGGEDHVADELRIEDLAKLQAWLEEQTPHPLAAIPPAWADTEPETRTARLAEAWEAAGSWPVRYGTERASILLGSPEGRAYFLCLCLRRSNPSFGIHDALRILGSITPLEWAALRRVAYGLTAREEIADELAPDRSHGGTANWCLSLHRASQCDGGPSYAEIRHWTVGQWRNFCAEGKPVEHSPEFSAQSKRARKVMGLDG